MDAKIFSFFKLNIGDLFTIEVQDFYYKLAENKKVYFGYHKKDDGWIHCPLITGTYCGDRDRNGELHIIKIRTSYPVKMWNAYYSYIVLPISYISSLEIIKINPKPSVLDELCHALD